MIRTSSRNKRMFSIVFFICIFNLTFSEPWYSKSQCTQKEYANHLDIDCQATELILIGWSHYGTKKSTKSLNSAAQCQPAESDCIMDYTHKIAELCNGISKCEVILTQQFIHKCSDEATYLFISYQCIRDSSIIDVCSKGSITAANGLNLMSPMFPNEYPNNINCTCSIEAKRKAMVIIDVENLSFNLQDNDKLLSFSGTRPFGASLLTARNQLSVNFQTDEMLSQSGFWIRVYGYQQCNPDEYTLGSKCLQIVSGKQSWKSARETCASMNSNLIHLHDIIQEKKLAYFLSTSTKRHPTSFWISNEKESHDIHSWWPWRSSNVTGKCLFRTPDGWIRRRCDEEHAFICERDINRQSIPLTVRCGNYQPTTIPSTRLTSTARTTVEVMRQWSSTSSMTKNMTQTAKTLDPNILAAIIGGVSLVIFSVNIVICCICRRRTRTPSKSKPPIDPNTSLTHEELQRSLMQHLYHEQTNTISSTSTSSSSSKHSKSNDTTTTSSNLFQLSPPSALYFRNRHIPNDQMDYHVYETIPSENLTYTLRTTHSAFKPIVPSATQPIQTYCPRTNILYHRPETYNTLSKIPPNTTVVMPVCCHHYSAGTRRPPQIYTRSESIV